MPFCSFAWFLGLGFLAGLTPLEEQPAEKPFAQVNGKTVTSAEFRAWLEASHGWRFEEDFLVTVLLRQAAEEIGAAVTEEDIDHALEEDWHHQILFRFDGNEQAFLDELRSGGFDRQGYFARRRAQIEGEILSRRLLKARTPTQEDLQRIYTEEFGEDGIRTHLRVAFFSKFHGKDLRSSPAADLIATLDAESAERAAAFRAALGEEGASFGALAAAQADPLLVPRHDLWVRDLRAADSELPRFQPGMFGGDLDALREDPAALVPGARFGPIASHRGYYVVEVVQHEPVTFDAVQNELVEAYRTRPPHPREMHLLRQKLLEAAKIER
jgi:hypothetical protein